ncbi:MAG: fructose-bisphosphate aldolase class II [Alphaproteobacteria bacterium GM202ARS2]|nr:fructose-bisphosphate aldolase class II [Alphaproteobacteria bacterium GM202ARS2]
MALVSMREILDHAASAGYGVPAFNVNNMEQVQAIMRAAERTDSPVIIQASRGARKYAGDVFLRHLLQAAVEQWPQVPIAMHLDHGNEPATCLSAIDAGFSSVMMDGSLEADGKTPASYDYNVAVTRKVVDAAHRKGVTVEGELGCLGSLESGTGEAEDGHGAEGVLERSALLTDPEQAKDFVARTGVDALAVAIGTSHGAYKFTRKPDGAILAMDVVRAIHQAVPNTHLVMHGSSSVPQDLQDLINQHGGAMKQTYGVPVEEIGEGIKNGVRKINIDTDCRMAITGTWRRVAQERPSEFDPRQFSLPAYETMESLCVQRYEAFGAAGQASKIKGIPLSAMAKHYQEGAL